MTLIFKFQGHEAEQHRLEAYDGLEALAGLARAATLIAHYAATGKIRHRKPYDEKLRFYFEDTRPGSLEAILALVSTPGGTIAAGIATGVAGNFVYALLARVWKRAVGRERESPLNFDGAHIGAGDIDALAEAVEPALTRGHQWIRSSGQQIVISGNNNQVAIFDSSSKEYLVNEVIAEGYDIQDVSVASLNVNSRRGRVYLADLGRTVPFTTARDATPRTIPTLAEYLSEYADNSGATVNIKFQRVYYQDGRLKRLIVQDCYALAGRV
ncbi:MAG: hypothetical protein JO290_08345 [Sphingomonadaceae bacterium]|nr:hypothetical protein [Sphingomonadaceae bacterium]